MSDKQETVPRWWPSMTDYRVFSYLERYLLDEVGPRFHSSRGNIEPVDMFMIFIWKSNRSKTRIRKTLKDRANGSFKVATKRIAKALFKTEGRKERLAILMRDWGLRLPMASAILTILYPKEFTVYDTRVCKMLELTYKNHEKFSETCWLEYEGYIDAVCKNTPSGFSLRDRDRFLWGKSLRQDAKRDAK